MSATEDSCVYICTVPFPALELYLNFYVSYLLADLNEAEIPDSFVSFSCLRT